MAFDSSLRGAERRSNPDSGIGLLRCARNLARALGLNPRQIDRLLDLRHGSTVGQLEKALRGCGRRVEIQARDLAAA